MASQFMGSIDVARRLNCSTEWVRRMANAGIIPAERTPSGRRIFDALEVERFAAEREEQRRQRQERLEQTGGEKAA
jgi:hypothetical protein